VDKMTEAKLTSALEECRTHFRRIATATEAIGSVFPLDSGGLDSLGDDRVAHIDQFIYRFSKLQDSMGTRLFPVVHGILQADDSPRPFIDIINRLEKLGFLSSVTEWQFFRELRNRFAHEYPERREQTIAALNELYASWPGFQAMYTAFVEKAEKLK